MRRKTERAMRAGAAVIWDELVSFDWAAYEGRIAEFRARLDGPRFYFMTTA